MNSSATSPRVALMSRARKHFVAIAATSVALTGGLTAYAAATGAAAQPPIPAGTSSQGSTSTPQDSSSTSQDSSWGSGLTSGSSNSSPDASSNAS